MPAPTLPETAPFRLFLDPLPTAMCGEPGPEFDPELAPLVAAGVESSDSSEAEHSETERRVVGFLDVSSVVLHRRQRSALQLCLRGTALRQRSAAQRAALTAVMRPNGPELYERKRTKWSFGRQGVCDIVVCTWTSRCWHASPCALSVSSMEALLAVAWFACSWMRVFFSELFLTDRAQARDMQVDSKTIRNCLTLMTRMLCSSSKRLDRMAQAWRCELASGYL